MDFLLYVYIWIIHEYNFDDDDDDDDDDDNNDNNNNNNNNIINNNIINNNNNNNNNNNMKMNVDWLTYIINIGIKKIISIIII